MSMDNPPPRMHERFKQYGEALSKGTTTEQLEAAENTIIELGKVFSKLYPDINPLAITLILAEFERIKGGNSPQFLISQNRKRGGRYQPLKNFRAASIVAAIDILKSNGMKLKDALDFVSPEIGLTEAQLRNMRKKFYSRKRMPDATEFLFKQLNIKHEDEAAMMGHVLALLQMAQNDEKEKTPDNSLSEAQ